MFSKDVVNWVLMEVKLISMNNFGVPTDLENANEFIDKAIDEIVGVLSKAAKAEVNRLIGEERQAILEDLSTMIPVTEVPAVQMPPEGGVQAPQLPDAQAPQLPPPQQPGAPITGALKDIRAAYSHSFTPEFYGDPYTVLSPEGGPPTNVADAIQHFWENDKDGFVEMVKEVFPEWDHPNIDVSERLPEGLVLEIMDKILETDTVGD